MIWQTSETHLKIQTQYWLAKVLDSLKKKKRKRKRKKKTKKKRVCIARTELDSLELHAL
jgi:hypothetical protein